MNDEIKIEAARAILDTADRLGQPARLAPDTLRWLIGLAERAIATAQPDEVPRAELGGRGRRGVTHRHRRGTYRAGGGMTLKERLLADPGFAGELREHARVLAERHGTTPGTVLAYRAREGVTRNRSAELRADPDLLTASTADLCARYQVSPALVRRARQRVRE